MLNNACAGNCERFTKYFYSVSLRQRRYAGEDFTLICRFFIVADKHESLSSRLKSELEVSAKLRWFQSPRRKSSWLSHRVNVYTHIKYIYIYTLYIPYIYVYQYISTHFIRSLTGLEL